MTSDTEISLRRPKWYERANEASFKPTAGGYVFQRPAPWLFARARYYLVSEAQKRELLEGLRRWRLLLLMASLVNVLVIIGVVLPMTMWPKTFAPVFVPVLRAVGPLGLGLTVMAAMALAMVPLIVIAQIHLARVLRAGLAGAPLTDERIRMRDQLPDIARSASPFVLAAGLIGGGCMLLGGVFVMVDAYQDGHLARTAPLASIGLVFGALLTAYFVWLLRLRVKQGRATAG
jgi:hypothetical protein